MIDRRNIAMTTLTTTTTTAGATLAQTLRIELRRFLDAILKSGARDEAEGRFHWGRGL
jgi:hypothetical protein